MILPQTSKLPLHLVILETEGKAWVMSMIEKDTGHITKQERIWPVHVDACTIPLHGAGGVVAVSQLASLAPGSDTVPGFHMP